MGKLFIWLRQVRKLFLRLNQMMYIVLNRAVFFINRVKCKDYKGFCGLIKIKNSINGNISFGTNVRINSGKNYNTIGFDTRTSFWTIKDGRIKIGNNVGISNSAFVSFKGITVEDDVLIGGGCKIYDTDFHALDYETRIEKKDCEFKCAEVLLKKGCFIGAGTTILKGVTIGEKSVVGACSVVTKSIPDGEIWAGNPAKFIRTV